MYILMIDNKEIIPLSTFREFIELEDDDSDKVNTILECKTEQSLLDLSFDIKIFEPYLLKNSIKLIQIKNDDGIILYSSNNYNCLYTARLLLDEEDTKTKIHLTFLR